VDWAWETFRLGRAHAYGLLPPPNREGSYVLTTIYLRTSLNDAAVQLSKAGVRLAGMLNRAFQAKTPGPEAARLGH
jgi:hypothetical protein